jgi:HAD superfamily hydrolase (TIGR01509 family)
VTELVDMPNPPNSARDAVILDCDGVLFDSVAANVAFYNAILDSLGEAPLTREQEGSAHALSSPQVLEELFGHDPSRYAAALRVAATIDYRPFLQLMAPVDGLHDVLGRLRANYRLAMATNRGRTIPDLLREFHLEDTFEVVVGILDVARPKPHPDMLIECARRLGSTCRRAVYVGDSPSDGVAASAAGIPFVAVGDRCDHPLRIGHLRELGDLLASERRRADLADSRHAPARDAAPRFALVSRALDRDRS